MQTTYVGNYAEQIAADYVERQGYKVIGRNWQRPDCEIDIIAQKDRTVSFVEVKYRFSDSAGSGMEYITTQKLRRMAYAASRWVAAHDWRGPYVLSAVEVSGHDFEVTGFIDVIEL